MIQFNLGNSGRLLKFGEKLSTIPGCPRTQGAVEALAEDLAEICDDWKEAEWLVKEARSRWEDWRGRHGLLKLLDERRPARPPENQAKDYGPKPEVSCKVCDDWGHYFDSESKTNLRCSCEAGQGVGQAFLAAINRGDPRRAEAVTDPSWERRRITEAEIDQAFRERQNAVNLVIADARSVLADESASPERKEIARETLRALRAEAEVSA